MTDKSATDILEKCALAGAVAQQCGVFVGGKLMLCDDARVAPERRDETCTCRAAARAVIATLADGVTERMAGAFNDAFEDPSLPDATTNEQAVCIGLSAAIRAAIPEGK